MEKQKFQQTITTQTTGTSTNPSWWTDKHTSAWDRVKDAFQRDWEQTKSDFSSGGHDLNQGADDTIKQAFGSAPVPPMTMANMDTSKPDERREKIAKVQEKAAEKIQKVEQNIAYERDKLDAKVNEVKSDLIQKEVEAKKKIAKAEEKAQEKLADARQSTTENIQKERQKILEATAERDEKMAKWKRFEPAMRYGYGLRAQYSDMHQWDDHFESKVKDEWKTVGGGTSWDESKPYIRRGWDYAGKH